MPASAPIQFTEMGLDPAVFRLAKRDEWHGICPWCGGVNRFVVHTDRPWPSWNWWCRQCERSGWADQLNEALRVPLSDTERQRLAERARQRQAAEQEKRRAILADFTSQELWAELHRRMQADNRRWWRERGISDRFQDWWSLGYTPAKSFYGQDGELVERPAYTIPYWLHGADFRRQAPVNMYYRLVDPPAGQGKYRTLQGAATYVSRPDLGTTAPIVLIVEGAIKSMVMTCGMKLHQPHQVYGLHSCNSFGDVAAWCQGAQRVYIMLDPGAAQWAVKLGREIGKAARVVELPAKPDDMIVKHGATPADMYRMMLSGRRV